MKYINGAIATIIAAGALAVPFNAAAQSYTNDIQQKLINADAMSECLFEKKMPISLDAVDALVAQGMDAEAAGNKLYQDAITAATSACEIEHQFTKDDYTIPFCPVEPFIVNFPSLLNI